ncbi:MAG: hypothetical protein HEQ23_10690 [Tepidisphaera sp.]
MRHATTNPAVLIRRAKLSFLPFLTLIPAIALCIGVFVPAVDAFMQRSGPFAAWALGILPVLIAVLLHAPIARRYYRQAASIIHEKNFNICPNCNYDISAINNPDRCPECAAQTSHQQRIEFWSRRLPKDMRQPPRETTSSSTL